MSAKKLPIMQRVLSRVPSLERLRVTGKPRAPCLKPCCAKPLHRLQLCALKDHDCLRRQNERAMVGVQQVEGRAKDHCFRSVELSGPYHPSHGRMFLNGEMTGRQTGLGDRVAASTSANQSINEPNRS
jgi:hypothetical protein